MPRIFLLVIYFQGDKQLDGYQKKKYVCKLLFIFLLGHDIDFGHMEAVNLLSSIKYTEKQIVSILLSFYILSFFFLRAQECLFCELAAMKTNLNLTR